MAENAGFTAQTPRSERGHARVELVALRASSQSLGSEASCPIATPHVWQLGAFVMAVLLRCVDVWMRTNTRQSESALARRRGRRDVGRFQSHADQRLGHAGQGHALREKPAMTRGRETRSATTAHVRGQLIGPPQSRRTAKSHRPPGGLETCTKALRSIRETSARAPRGDLRMG